MLEALSGKKTYIVAIMGAVITALGLAVDSIQLFDAAIVIWNAVMAITIRLGIAKIS